MQRFPCSLANLAGRREKVSSCLVSSQWKLDRAARQRVRATLHAVQRPALRGRHGVDAGEHVQPLRGERRARWKKGDEDQIKE